SPARTSRRSSSTGRTAPSCLGGATSSQSTPTGHRLLSRGRSGGDGRSSSGSTPRRRRAGGTEWPSPRHWPPTVPTPPPSSPRRSSAPRSRTSDRATLGRHESRRLTVFGSDEASQGEVGRRDLFHILELNPLRTIDHLGLQGSGR